MTPETPTPLPQETLDELDRLEKEATPGPWKADGPHFGLFTIREDPKDWDGMGYQFIAQSPAEKKGTDYGAMFRANAGLIAAARNALRPLLDEVRWHRAQGLARCRTCEDGVPGGTCYASREAGGDPTCFNAYRPAHLAAPASPPSPEATAREECLYHSDCAAAEAAHRPGFPVAHAQRSRVPAPSPSPVAEEARDDEIAIQIAMKGLEAIGGLVGVGPREDEDQASFIRSVVEAVQRSRSPSPSADPLNPQSPKENACPNDSAATGPSSSPGSVSAAPAACAGTGSPTSPASATSPTTCPSRRANATAVAPSGLTSPASTTRTPEVPPPPSAEGARRAVLGEVLDMLGRIVFTDVSGLGGLKLRGQERDDWIVRATARKVLGMVGDQMRSLLSASPPSPSAAKEPDHDR